jgi:hypothetical protein
LLHSFEVPHGVLADNSAAAFSSDGKQLAFAAGEGARLYDLDTGAVMKAWELPEGFADSIRFEDESHLFLLRREWNMNRTARGQWRARNLMLPGTNWTQPVFEGRDTNWLAYETAWPMMGNHFLVVGRRADDPQQKGVYKLFNMHTGAEVFERVSGINYQGSGVVMDPTGRWLRIHLKDGPYLQEIIEVPTGRVAMEVDTPYAISPSGTMFAAHARNGGCLFFEGSRASDGVTLAMDSRLGNIAWFSPDGRKLTWGTREGTVLVADLVEVKRRLALLSKPNGR